MDRSALRTILIAVLCLSVLALAAATLDTTQTGGSDFGSGGGSGGGDGPGDGGSRPTPSPETPDPQPTAAQEPEQPPELCAPIVKEPPVIIAVVLAAVITFLLLLKYYNEFVAIAGTLMVFGPIGLIMLVLARCERPEPDPELDPGNLSSGNSSGGSGGVGGDGSGLTEPTLPILLLAIVAVLIVLGAVAYYLTGDDTIGDAGDDPDEDADDEEDGAAVDAADVAKVGRMAGEAADRLEASGDFENEVYRAWREMTRPLNVPRPQSSTPREFAEAAVGAGMNGDDVDRLTELFDEVRYGGREATPEREREAVSLLRSIEAAYADVDSAADLPDGEADPSGGTDDAEVDEG